VPPRHHTSVLRKYEPFPSLNLVRFFRPPGWILIAVFFQTAKQSEIYLIPTLIRPEETVLLGSFPSAGLPQTDSSCAYSTNPIAVTYGHDARNVKILLCRS
jgi:hypothetical protein